MSDGADTRTRALIDRVAAVSGVTPVAAATAGEPPEAGRIEVRLVDLRPRIEPRALGRPDVIALDYLVAVRVADPLEEHRLAAEAMFALQADPDFEIVPDRSAAEVSVALGLPAAAGLVARTLLSRASVLERAPLVRFPLQPRPTPAPPGSTGPVQKSKPVSKP